MRLSLNELLSDKNRFINPFLHPFKYMRLRKILSDIKQVSGLLIKYQDNLAAYFEIEENDQGDIVVSMNYCNSGTGDLNSNRSVYIFNGYDDFGDLRLYNSFRNLICRKPYRL